VHPGQAVYETFLASGTILMAAQSTGRVCYGVEIDPLFVDLAIRRWQAFTGEKAHRLSDGQMFEAAERMPTFRLPDAIALYRDCEPAGRNHDADRIRVRLYTREQKPDFDATAG
jgi:tRNA G10  N-methylase Trm11